MCYSSSVDIMHVDYSVLCMHTATATATAIATTCTHRQIPRIWNIYKFMKTVSATA